MNTGRLSGKSVLITAAANGIGRETALTFAREGAQVLATDISESGLASLKSENAAITTELLDVTSAQAVNNVFSRHQFNVVFNCAGFVHQGTIEECDEEAWTNSFRINVESMYRICRHALPQMVAAGGGSIINMSSVCSSIKGIKGRFAYGTTKAAVLGLTKSIAADYAHKQIRCNAVCPGTVHTPSLEQRAAATGGNSEATWKAFIDRQPMGRLGTAAEIAALVLYLASDDSAFTTGAAFVIDGGLSN
ncbi:MAG TPA: SDR family oxidoreductase [Steroidobacteraceae bacterium]|nr:SDR family oxidoreductase [Steroidobacteraceae bacterium]